MNSSSLDLDIYIKIMIVLYLYLTFSLSSMQEYLGKPIRVSLCVLGSEVPEWFSYKSTEGSSVKIKLPAHRNHTNSTDQFSGFTFCAVVSFGPCQNDGDFDIRCECHLITKGGVQSDLIFNNKGDEEKRLSPLKREHEFLKGA